MGSAGPIGYPAGGMAPLKGGATPPIIGVPVPGGRNWRRVKNRKNTQTERNMIASTKKM
jgi:hypothetical protein